MPIALDGLPEGDGCEILNAGFCMENSEIGTDQPPPRLGENQAK